MDSSDNLVISARTDREAFGKIFDLYYPNVFRYCLRRLFVRAVAEDVTSEVFLRVATHIRDFPGTTKEDFQALALSRGDQRGERLGTPYATSPRVAGIRGERSRHPSH